MPYLIALILVITPFYIIRFNILGIPTTLLEISIYGVFLIGAIKYFLKKSGMRYPTKHIQLFIFIALFFLSAVFSAFISPDLKNSLGALKSWFIDGLLVFLSIIFYVKNKKDFSVIVGGLSAGAFLVSAVGLWQYFANNVLPDGRITSLYIYDNVLIASGGLSNFIALYLAPIILLQIGLLFSGVIARSESADKADERQSNSVDIWKILLSAMAVLELFALYLTRSYGGLLGIAVGLLVLLVYKIWHLDSRGNKKIIVGVIGGIIIILLFFPQVGTNKFKNLFKFNGASSTNARVQIWQASWLMIKDHPVAGVGLNNFEKVYREYVPKVVFPPLEWLVPHSHNLYMSLWLETGILGLVSFLGLVFVTTRKLIRSNNILAISIVTSLVSILIHGLVDTPILKNDLAIVFWTILGIGYYDGFIANYDNF